jgi:hypothetical protein
MRCIYFPALHRELAQPDVPRDVLFIDPGIVRAEAGESHWRPSWLPLNGEESERFLRECSEFGQRFRDPAELEALAARGPEDFFSGTSMSIRHQLRRRMEQAGDRGQEEEFETRLQAQMFLLLAWFAEEKVLEMQELERGLQAQWSALQEAMGEGADRATPTSPLFSGGSGTGLVSWRRLVPWFLLLLPPGTSLYVQETEIVQEWMEFGVSFDPAEQEESGDGCAGPGMRIATAKGWRLALRRSPAVARTWLNSDYRVVAGC